MDWDGLKIDGIRLTDVLYAEYKRKAQNWMYGRRARQYGDNLYPIMLQTAHQVIYHLSVSLGISCI